jgi:hypothetical protein
MRIMARRPVDPGLAAITAWRDWFVAAHEARLRDSPDQHLVEQERAAIAAQAAAIAERMRSDYLLFSRTRP